MVVQVNNDSMEVIITKIVDWDIAYDNALFTIHKTATKQPSEKWKASACLSEHSMLSDVRFIIELRDIPTWVSQHIARHDVFAGHNIRESKEVHYVATQRTDRVGVDRNKLPQDSPVCHRINLSAKDLINISRLRLCHKASNETRLLWKEVIKKLAEIEPTLASKCVRSCIYRGFCPEFESCGYDCTKKFFEKVREYRKR